MQTFRKLLSLLTSVEKKNAVFLLIMITIMALLDTIGVASILPFIAVLTNPNLIETNIFLSSLFKISNMFGVKTIPEFLFALGITVFVILIISLTFKALKVSEIIKITNTVIPKAKRNSGIVFTPNIFEILNKLLKKILVSMRLGFVRTAIKGKMEATPIVSNNAIIVIIINKKTAFFFSTEVSKESSFLKVCIKLVKLLKAYN